MVCRERSRPFRAALPKTRHSEKAARRSARFYALRAAICADGSRPIPTNIPVTGFFYKLGVSPTAKHFCCTAHPLFGLRPGGANPTLFIIYYLLSIIFCLYQYTTLPHFSAPYISPSFWVKIGQFFSVSPVAICLRCPYNRVITARALRMCFRSALFH